ncbi:MAG: substrate-binding domain-containing protein [Oscillospiraceae bacterium]|nr:substrate-binding domain-containing protein [Oscillospiraceae bacterium]
MKKLIALLLAVMLIATLAACGNGTPEAAPAPEAPPAPEATPAPEPDPDPVDEGPSYVAVISKGFQHQFWQAVYAGALAAGEDYGVRVSFDGPESEADIGPQLDMLRAALAREPDALAFAALDTAAALAELQDAFDRGIPVIGFDSGVPEAPAGQVLATAATDNVAAGAVGADNMFPEIVDAISEATPASPVTIAILSQDVTSESITGRTRGFAERMLALASDVNDSVAIIGGFAAINTGDEDAAVRIQVVVGATPDIVDMTSAAHGILNSPNNLVGVFCSNEGAVVGLLSTIVAGTAVPEGVVLVGFDAGSMQKGAVEQGIMFGSVTQDPFQIGYQAVSLAVRAARGESVGDVDTGAQWWNADNMHNPDIAILLYD